MNLQIIRIRHPPVVYLEQVAVLHTEEGFSATSSDIRRRVAALPGADRLLLAVDGESLIGYAHLRFSCDLFNEKTAEIVSLLVRHPHRRKNIGRRLITTAETWARESGCSRLLLRADPDQSDAREFFTALGFSQGANLLEFERLLGDEV
ncbi:MAG: GNAT family N-acetyltransferase [Anaerolineales bacterium]|nr:GNAT family N-acetyltransferase [Anaerolineales bacterium]